MCKVDSQLFEQSCLNPGSIQKPCALVVDDHAVNRLVLRTLLSKLGFDVFEANNGLQALAKLRRLSRQVSFVLLDLQMPVLDGWATARLLRAEYGASLPIVACTASDLSAACQPGGPSVQAHALDCGVNLCLVKPTGVPQLTAALQQLKVMTPQLLPATAARAPAAELLLCPPQ